MIDRRATGDDPILIYLDQLEQILLPDRRDAKAEALLKAIDRLAFSGAPTPLLCPVVTRGLSRPLSRPRARSPRWKAVRARSAHGRRYGPSGLPSRLDGRPPRNLGSIDGPNVNARYPRSRRDGRPHGGGAGRLPQLGVAGLCFRSALEAGEPGSLAAASILQRYLDGDALRSALGRRSPPGKISLTPDGTHVEDLGGAAPEPAGRAAPPCRGRPWSAPPFCMSRPTRGAAVLNGHDWLGKGLRGAPRAGARRAARASQRRRRVTILAGVGGALALTLRIVALARYLKDVVSRRYAGEGTPAWRPPKCEKLTPYHCEEGSRGVEKNTARRAPAGTAFASGECRPDTQRCAGDIPARLVRDMGEQNPQGRCAAGQDPAATRANRTWTWLVMGTRRKMR